jgi:hypothetical protein
VPEKAHADKIQNERGNRIGNQNDMRRYLAQNLRIDKESIEKLKAGTISILAERYRSRKLRLLVGIMVHMQKESAHHE